MIGALRVKCLFFQLAGCSIFQNCLSSSGKVGKCYRIESVSSEKSSINVVFILPAMAL